MIIKFVPTKKGGGTSSIDYLLNEREVEGTAKVLQGDPKLTRDIIKSINRKQKTTFGVMSFEEKNIDEALKYKLMEDLEKTLLPGMSKDEYNILWVEHTDKDRLELNFIIPKTHLPTDKALQPYYHKQDLPRLDKLQRIMNLENDFTDPHDPSKARTLETNTKEIHLSKNYEELDKTLHKLASEQKIQNREQMVELLIKNDFKVTRTTENSISIKMPDSKKAKRFKGSIYNERYTSTKELNNISREREREIKQYNTRDTQKELGQLKSSLREYNQHKAKELNKSYSFNDKSRNELQQKANNISINNNDLDNNKSRNILPSTNKMDNSNKQQTNNRKPRLSSNRKERSTNERERENKILHKGKLNDKPRNPIIERIRTKREENSNARKALTKKRGSIYKTIRENGKHLPDKLRESYQQVQRTIKHLGHSISEVIRTKGQELINKARLEMIAKQQKEKQILKIREQRTKSRVRSQGLSL